MVGYWSAWWASRCLPRLCRLLGQEEWLSDARFASDATRGEHADAITEVMAAWVREPHDGGGHRGARLGAHPMWRGPHTGRGARTRAGARDALHAGHGIPRPRADVSAATHAHEFSAAGMTDKLVRPPRLGEHTDAILRELAFGRAANRSAARGSCGMKPVCTRVSVISERVATASLLLC